MEQEINEYKVDRYTKIKKKSHRKVVQRMNDGIPKIDKKKPVEDIKGVEELPLGWDFRPWRLQVYDWICQCADKLNTTPVQLLIDSCGAHAKSKDLILGWKEDKVIYKNLYPTMIQKITIKAGIPLIIY